MNHPMFKSIFTATLFLVLSTYVYSQDKSERASPPAEVSAEIGKAQITINYSQPAVKGRKIWGGLVPYDKIWRTGANEATTIETTAPLVFGDLKLDPGKYSLFTIPAMEDWTVIFNAVADQWGNYQYDASKDVLRIKAMASQSDAFHERMTFAIAGDGNRGEIHLLWEDLVLKIPFTTSM